MTRFRTRLGYSLISHVSIVAIFLTAFYASAESRLPSRDQRASEIKTLNTPRTFPAIKSKPEWERTRNQIRDQILVSAGLWPMPEKTPLNASVFGKIDHA